MSPTHSPIHIGSLVFDGLDQIDLTGPFEVLSRMQGATHRLYSPTGEAVRDVHGLRITPDAPIAHAPPLDILHVPGGSGQQALMHDEAVLAWLASQAGTARKVLSVCTGALLLGGAGLLRGRRATTHWNSFHLLPLFGATPVDARVVIDGDWIFAAGVTAGIDGALRLVAELQGDAAAQRIQLDIAYAPEPPFDSGTPETAPREIAEAARQAASALAAQREKTAHEVAVRLGIERR